MFIILAEENDVVLNLNAYDLVEIHEGPNSFILRASKRIEGPIYDKRNIQSYSTYEQALDGFRRMVDALTAGKHTWYP